MRGLSKYPYAAMGKIEDYAGGVHKACVMSSPARLGIKIKRKLQIVYDNVIKQGL
jgi:hypothetical protein